MKLFLILSLLLSTKAYTRDHAVKFNDVLHDFCFYVAYHIDYKECKSHVRSCVDKTISRPDDSRKTHSQKVMKAYRFCIEDI